MIIMIFNVVKWIFQLDVDTTMTPEVSWTLQAGQELVATYNSFYEEYYVKHPTVTSSVMLYSDELTIYGKTWH